MERFNDEFERVDKELQRLMLELVSEDPSYYFQFIQYVACGRNLVEFMDHAQRPPPPGEDGSVPKRADSAKQGEPLPNFAPAFCAPGYLYGQSDKEKPKRVRFLVVHKC